MPTKTIIIEIEGYTQLDSFIIKEIAFYDIETMEYKNYFIRSEKITTASYYWLLKYLHHIPWYYGKTSMNYIQSKYFDNPNIEFYVKSFQKFQILQKFTKNKIHLLDNIGCEQKLIHLPKPSYRLKCEYKYHDKTDHCALHKVSILAYWYRNGQIDRERKSTEGNSISSS